MITVQFRCLTGIPDSLFSNARLSGSWNGWVEVPMEPVIADDGCPAFAARVEFEDARAGEPMRWGVRLDGPSGTDVWGIAAEVGDAFSQERVREFVLPAAGDQHEPDLHEPDHEERYYLTWG